MSPVAVQSTQETPPTPHASAVVPLLQFPPLSQHPAHWGQGPLAPDDDDLADVDGVVVEVERDELVDGFADDEDERVRELVLVLAREAVPLDPAGPAVAARVVPALPFSAVDAPGAPLLP